MGPIMSSSEQIGQTIIEERHVDMPFLFSLAAMFAIIVGIILFIFSLAYVDDIETLKNAPDLIWAFVCGRPNDANIVVPLVMTLSVLSLVTSAILFAFSRYLKHRDLQRP